MLLDGDNDGDLDPFITPVHTTRDGDFYENDGARVSTPVGARTVRHRCVRVRPDVAPTSGREPESRARPLHGMGARAP